MDQFIIDNDHIKSYTVMVTDWNNGPYGRVLRPHVIRFDHNQRVSALVEQLRQDLLVKEPNLCMTGELSLNFIQNPSLDNEALLKKVIPEPEKVLLHTNCYGIQQSRNEGKGSMSILQAGKKAASTAGAREDLARFANIRNASRTQQQVPDEIIMFAIDTSESMRSPAASGISANDWLGMDQEAITSRHLSSQAGSVRCKEAITSMPFQELTDALSREEYFEDLLAILHVHGSIDEATRASSNLKHLQKLCARERRHYEELIIKASQTPGTDSRQRQDDIHNGSRYVKLYQIELGLIEHNSDLVKWLREYARRNFKESPWRCVHDGTTETGEWQPTKDRTLIKVYQGREHMRLFSYWVDRTRVLPYASVIFRYWRYLAEERGQDFDKDVDIWTEIRYVGDGKCVGRLNSHWDGIPQSKPNHGAGHLGPEPLYFKPGDSSNVESDQNTLVLKMHIESHDFQRRMNEAEDKRKNSASRLLISQTFLDTFLDRVLAFNLNCHIGVVTFNNVASLVRRPTRRVQDLYGSIDCVQPGGDTCICDALDAAGGHLMEYAIQYPMARRRIICLSDGVESDSPPRDEGLVEDLLNGEIVVDSVSVGPTRSILQAATWLTGGDDYTPENIDEFLAIAQLEPFLSQLQREPLPQPRLGGTMDVFENTRAIRATPDDRRLRPSPPGLDHLKHRFLDPNFAIISHQKSANAAPRDTIDIMQPGPANLPHNRIARARAEIRNIRRNSSIYYRIFISEEDITCWLVRISPDTPDADATLYGRGVWVFHLHMHKNYPLTAPDVRFKTPIHHLNVNLDGRICHRLLYQDWTPETTNIQIIEAVLSVLVRPSLPDAINLTAFRQVFKTGLYYCEYEDEIDRQMKKYATRDREDWTRAIKDQIKFLPGEGPNQKLLEMQRMQEFRLALAADAEVEMDPDADPDVDMDGEEFGFGGEEEEEGSDKSSKSDEYDE